MIYFILSIAIVLCAVILYFMNRWIKKYINPNCYPNNIWFRHNFQRNYQYILLGNGIVNKLFSVDWKKGSGFNLALRNQSLTRDFEVLKQNFSILRENGFAIFVLTAASFVRPDDVEDKRPYIFTQFGYTLSLNHFVQNYKKLCKYYPIFMFRFIDIYYWALHVIGKDEQTYRDQKRLKCLGNNNSDLANKNFSDIIKSIIEFCEQRRITPIFPILDFLEYKSDLSSKVISDIERICNDLGAKTCKIVIENKTTVLNTSILELIH